MSALIRSHAEHITQILDEVRKGDQQASDKLMEVVYADLRGIAGSFFARERPDHTLQPTALVHEAYIRIFAGAKVNWQDRNHFFAVAARQMRRVLIDHNREFRAAKRGSGLKVEFDEGRQMPAGAGCEVEEVNELLDRLERTDATAAKVIEMKFFAGMTDEEVAAELGVSHSTVRRHWDFAKAWLVNQLAKS